MLRGDWDKLDRLLAFPRLIQGTKLRAGVAKAGMEGAMEALALGFSTETDPSGIAWPKSRRAALEGGQTLSDTGLLRRSFRHRSDHTGFWLWVAGPPAVYAATHQYGATIRPKRARYLKVPVLGRVKGRPRARPVRWVFLRSVTIPQREMVPEGFLPSRWWSLMLRSVEAYLRMVEGGRGK